MKKTLAAGSAVAVGIIGAAAPLAAVPAQAAIAPTCDTNVSMTSNPADMDNWYQSCVPQFGVGKVEFTISSEVDFPAGFSDLTDPDVSVETTTDLDSLYLYWGGASQFPSEPTSPFVNLERVDDGTDPKVQRYAAYFFPDASVDGYAYFTVNSVARTTVADLPDSCLQYGSPGDFSDVFVATFDPIDTTFSQTVNGEDWSYRIVIAPQPTYIAGTLQFNGSTDAWLYSAPMCMAQGAFVSGGPLNGNVGWSSADTSASFLNPYSSNVWNGDAYYVGDYPRTVTPSTLPETGINFGAAIVFAAGMIVTGLAVAKLRRRRA